MISTEWIILIGIWFVITEILYYLFVKDNVCSKKDVKENWGGMKFASIVLSMMLMGLLYVLSLAVREFPKETVCLLGGIVLIVGIIWLWFYLNYKWAMKIKGIKPKKKK